MVVGVVGVGKRRMGEGLVAGAVASLPSGTPSTVHALWTGRDLLDTARAAGSLLAPVGASDGRLLASGVVAHMAISLGWGAVLGMVLPRKAPVAWGAAAGLAIAALDLGVVGRRVPAIRSLPVLPQIADHVAYGALVGAVLARRAREAPLEARLGAWAARPRTSRSRPNSKRSSGPPLMRAPLPARATTLGKRSGGSEAK